LPPELSPQLKTTTQKSTLNDLTMIRATLFQCFCCSLARPVVTTPPFVSTRHKLNMNSKIIMPLHPLNSCNRVSQDGPGKRRWIHNVTNPHTHHILSPGTGAPLPTRILLSTVSRSSTIMLCKMAQTRTLSSLEEKQPF
jgi:hypothetical protein